MKNRIFNWYAHFIDPLFIENLIDKILPFADEFLMEGIKYSARNTCFDLRLIFSAETYELLRLKKKAVEYVRKNLSFHEILDNKIF